MYEHHKKKKDAMMANILKNIGLEKKEPPTPGTANKAFFGKLGFKAVVMMADLQSA